MALNSIKFDSNSFKISIIDQLKLPFETSYIDISNTKDAWTAIRTMQIRGAPAIGVLACLGVAVEMKLKTFATKSEIVDFITTSFEYLCTARPTGINVRDAKDKFINLAQKLSKDESKSIQEMKQIVLKKLEDTLPEDIELCKTIGKLGADYIVNNFAPNGDVKILTHCNTGSLATAGYGTALGVVRALHSMGKLKHCFHTETRPYNQGSRLTAYECIVDNIPSSMICDSAASLLMSTKGVTAVITGADQITANGDTANKIGTFQLAIAAKYHNIPFLIAAPSTSCRLSAKTGADIKIEERNAEEMTKFYGHRTAPEGVQCWNPAFDVTPADLITAIVTEFGVFKPSEFATKLASFL